MKRSIFIFRRDLRVEDNLGLRQALEASDTVIPIFIFTEEQIGHKNAYRSDNAIQFMVESLKELNTSLEEKYNSKLFCFYGNNQAEVIQKLIKMEKINAVYVNMDYTAYSTKRDNGTKKVCEDAKCEFHQIEDVLLHPVGTFRTTGSPKIKEIDNKEIDKNNNKNNNNKNYPNSYGSEPVIPKSGEEPNIYVKFTPYYNRAKKLEIQKPIISLSSKLSAKLISKNHKISSEIHLDNNQNNKIKYIKNEDLHVHGGRKEALKILSHISDFKDYEKNRNTLSMETTNLSAYNKFGCVSIREVYWAIRSNKALGANHSLIRQLFWRDFYYNIAYFYPQIFSGQPMKEKYAKLEWRNNPEEFRKWKNGETGIPIVDAGMRQLNQTGYMHNRARLITSNFLIKLLQIDWRKGEQYYASKLVDYDPAVNNGNWQWSSSSGADSQPYFRIFNPWLQTKNFDPKGEYIKRWIPELQAIEPKKFQKEQEKSKESKETKEQEKSKESKEAKESKESKEGNKYPTPMVNYEAQRKLAVKMYADIFK